MTFLLSHPHHLQICSSDDLLGKSSGCRRLTFQSSGCRRLTWKSSGQRRDYKQNYYRSFIYKDKLGFHLSRQDQTTFKKSRRLLRSPDDFQETTSRRLYRKSRRLLGSPDDFQMTSRRLYRKSRRLLGSPDDFQTTSRRLTIWCFQVKEIRVGLESFSLGKKHKNLPKHSEKSRRIEVQTTSWKSRRLPGSPDDFLEVQTTLSEDFQEVQTTNRSEKPANSKPFK
ncbi:hypothetical protein IGI04_000456 [Brassica rapa subsp. trilocularis]|uniref:Uncharacterized protein n=1 Tax=Brassica rapa subsp. trilocularis TaxID=1813537 RepID=A0ABQ7NT48_BRACM|nr:hypothetical protein IGI04_000456 [Brassica rapa subsp. trilocularis]